MFAYPCEVSRKRPFCGIEAAGASGRVRTEIFSRGASETTTLYDRSIWLRWSLMSYRLTSN